MTDARDTRPQRWRLLVACISLTLLLLLSVGAVSAFAEPAEIEFYDGTPIPPNVRPVVICSGSDFEMGYQYFQQFIVIYGDGWLTNYVGKQFTDAQIMALKARQWTLMDEIPWFIEFAKGAAAGATDAGVEMSYAEALAYFCGVKTFPGQEPPGSQDEDLPPGECSGFAAWGSATTDGSLVAVGTSDGQDRGTPSVTVMFYPEDGNNIVGQGRGVNPMWHPAMNNKGLCYVHHSAGYVGNYAPGYGVPRHLALLNTLRYADNAVQAKEMMLGYSWLGETRFCRGVWADVKGNAFAIESADPMAVRTPGYMGEKDFIYATNNAMNRELESLQEPDPDLGLYYIPHAGYLGATYHYYDTDAVPRNLFMWNALHNYSGKVDVEFAKMMLRFPGEPPAYPSLEEAEAALVPTLGKGWNAPIGELSNHGNAVCQPDDGDEGVYSVVQFRAARVAYPLCEDYEFYYPEDLYTFYKVTLAATPDDTVQASLQNAQHALYYADQVLRGLTYHDPAYAPLNEFFDEAARCWLSGQNESDLAGRTEGNEANAHLNKAIRAFTKCEAYANHVYESLVPPPDDPTDLGLKKWFGGWGDWATRGYPWDSDKKQDQVAEVIVPPNK